MYQWNYYGKRHIISKTSDVIANPISIDLGHTLLTDLGRELFPIAGATPNEPYRQIAVRQLRKAGWEVIDAC
jgi:hypothetical protein